MAVVVRPARADERAEVAEIHRSSATLAYAGIFPPGDAFPWEETLTRWLNFAGEIRVAESEAPGVLMPRALDLEHERDLAESRHRGFQTAEAAFQLGIVPSRTQLVGFVAFDVCKLHALYVLPEYWNRGLGEQLLEAAGGVCELWVLADNARARRFYEKWGWEASGLEGQHHSGASIIELCYVRRG